MISQRKQNQEVVLEGSITKAPAIAVMIIAGLDVIVLIILARITKSGFINASLLFWILLAAALAFSLYSFWLASSEKLFFYNDRLVYKSHNNSFVYDYSSIGIVYIHNKSAGRGFHREYLIIPIHREKSSKQIRRRLSKSISAQGEIHRIAQDGHLICVIRNSAEKELLYSFLHDKVEIMRE